MKRNHVAFVIGLAALGLAGATELLRFDFNDPAHLADQGAGLPPGTIIGPVQASATSGSADFSGGLIKRPGSPGPQGPFSIEARSGLRSYGNEDSRLNADIVNTAPWDSDPGETAETPTQGF